MSLNDWGCGAKGTANDEAPLNAPGGGCIRATRPWARALQRQLTCCKMGQPPHPRMSKQRPEGLSNWSLFMQLLNGAGYTQFLLLRMMPHHSSSWESLSFSVGLSWFALLYAVCRLHTKSQLLCQVDNRCHRGLVDQESWRVNFCHLTWCPRRCLSDWSPRWALRPSSEIEARGP